MKTTRWIILVAFAFLMGASYANTKTSVATEKQTTQQVQTQTKELERPSFNNIDQGTLTPRVQSTYKPVDIPQEGKTFSTQSQTDVEEHEEGTDVGDAPPPEETTPIPITVEQPKVTTTQTVTPVVVQPQTQPATTKPTSSYTAKNITKEQATIGGVTIMDDFQVMMTKYKDFYTPEDNSNGLIFFNGGEGQYGDFISTVQLQNNKYIKYLTFTQWGKTSPVTMSIGTIKVGDGKDKLINVYGKWDQEEVNYDVKKLVYNHLAYNGMALTVSFYLDSHTDIVYGYEILVK